MAQRIIIQTLCDEHLERDEAREAQTYEVLVRLASSSVKVREIDLCDECSAPFVAMGARAAELGRTSGQPPRQTPAKVKAMSSVKTTPAESSAPASSNGDDPKAMATCPVSGCGAVVVQTNLRAHIREKHGLSLEEATPGMETPYVCDDCGRGFGRPQALAVHRTRRHSSAAAAAS